ncbi:IclR family transcriptional regulator [Mycobacterium triplex]|nr:IclR family transcriptional regulator C-terminal domain-containing protein [Mycobacterium triplex]
MVSPNSDSSADATQQRDPVAQRILLVLEACAAMKRPPTMTDLVEATGLAKTTVHRMCWKLVELGLLERSADGFCIGTKIFALANANPIISEVRVAAMPHLVELQRCAGASNLAILTGGKALVIDGLFNQELRPGPLLGVGLPLHCTAVGKAIAASLDADYREQLLGSGLLPAATRRTIVHPAMIRRHLERVAAEGVALSHEEFQLGTRGVAAAFAVSNGTTAAIGCVGAWNNAAISRSAARVAAAAASLQRTLSSTEKPAC